MIVLEFKYECGYQVQFAVTDRFAPMGNLKKVYGREADFKHAVTCSRCLAKEMAKEPDERSTS